MTSEYTPEELLTMSDDDFAEVVTEDFQITAASRGPYQHESVIRRTLTALIDHLSHVDSVIRKRAEDPDCTAEQYESTLAFRRHLLAVINVTDRREAWLEGQSAYSVSLWKQHMHALVDELEGGPEDRLLDEFMIPFPNGELTLRTWRDVRVEKDPRRAMARKVAA